MHPIARTVADGAFKASLGLRALLLADHRMPQLLTAVTTEAARGPCAPKGTNRETVG